MNHLPNDSIKKNIAKTIISQIAFDFGIEEEFPFTRSLFDDILLFFKGINITIADIEHQQYENALILCVTKN